MLEQQLQGKNGEVHPQLNRALISVYPHETTVHVTFCLGQVFPHMKQTKQHLFSVWVKHESVSWP